ncbi:MAG: hypothetical protein JNK38_03165 [Acidobacteria bacterium]|nr:hypothetical protein [Acidobacteriota bacterium]
MTTSLRLELRSEYSKAPTTNSAEISASDSAAITDFPLANFELVIFVRLCLRVLDLFAEASS